MILTMSSTDPIRSPAIEDYAKAIYALEVRSSEPVGNNALAERLGRYARLRVGDGQADGRARVWWSTFPTGASR